MSAVCHQMFWWHRAHSQMLRPFRAARCLSSLTQGDASPLPRLRSALGLHVKTPSGREEDRVSKGANNRANRQPVGTRTRLSKELHQLVPAPWTVPYVLYVISVLLGLRLRDKASFKTRRRERLPAEEVPQW